MSYYTLQANELKNRLRRLVEDAHPTWLTWHQMDLLLPEVRTALLALKAERDTLMSIHHPEGPALAALVADVIHLHNRGTLALDMGAKHPIVPLG